MNEKEFNGKEFAADVVSAVKASQEQMRAEFLTEIAQLKSRLAKLEARGELKYLGTWEPGEYSPGVFLTCGDCVWYCNAPTTQRPGGGNSCWTMAVKRGPPGRDGKDAVVRGAA